MRFEDKYGKKYEVDFGHRKQKMTVPPNAPANKQKEVEALITSCGISVNDNGKMTQVSAQSICRPPDQFSKPLGRKLALTRALKISGLTEDEKALIWDTYIKSLDTKRRVVAGFGTTNQGLLFIQTPTKLFAKATKEWQSNQSFNKKAQAKGTDQRPTVACPLPMDHPFFVDPDKYGFKVV